jgi:putative FmdB family regulatory protein
MPTYQYECGACNHRFEKRQSFSDDTVADCPQCSQKSRRVMCPAPIMFKGNGFYVNDYPRSGKSST